MEGIFKKLGENKLGGNIKKWGDIPKMGGNIKIDR